MTKFDPTPTEPFEPFQPPQFGSQFSPDPAEVESDFTVWDHVFDVGAAPLRGVEGFINSVYNLGDAIVGDALPDWDDARFLGHSETVAGSLVEGMAQFLTGFIPGIGLAGKAGKLARLGKLGKGAKKAHNTMRKHSVASRIGRDLVVGMGTDFFAYKAHEARLSNLLKDNFDLDNAVVNYLAADADDSELEGRIKNLLEGAGLGVAVDAFVQGIKAMARMKGGKIKGVETGDPEAGVVGDPMKGVDHDFNDVSLVTDKMRAKDQQEAMDQVLPEFRPDDAAAKRVTEEDELIELTKTAKKAGGVYSVEIEGNTYKFYRDVALRVWRMADTDEILTLRDKSKAHAVAELRDRAKGAAGDAVLDSVEIKRPRTGVHEPNITAALDALRRVQQIEDAGGQATNPRHPDGAVGEVMETHLNLSNVAPTDKGWTSYVRAVEQLYDEARPPDVDAQTMITMDQRAGDELKDLLGILSEAEIPEWLAKDLEFRKAGEDVLAEARRASNKKRAWVKVLKEVARDAQRKATEALGAAPEVAGEARVVYAIAMDRLESATRTVRGLGAISGRDLVMHKAGFVGAARLQVLARRAYQGGPGAKKFDELMRQTAHMPEESGIIELAKKAHRSPTPFDALIEFWLSAILSSGRTFAINPISNGMVAMYRPFEKLVGAGLAGNLPGMKQAMSDYSNMINNFWSAMRVGFADMRAGHGRFLGGSKYEDVSGPQKAMVADTFGLSDTSVAGRLINTLGKMRYSGAILTGQDSFAKYLSFHVNAENLLRRVHLERQIDQGVPMDPEAAATWASKKVKELTYDNQVINETVLNQKHMDELNPDDFVNDNEMMDEAKRLASEEWNSEDSLLMRLVNQNAGTKAKIDTYTNPLSRDGRVIERSGALAQDWAQSVSIAKFFIPFIRTPTNLLTWAADRTTDPLLGMMRIWWSKVVGGRVHSMLGDGALGKAATAMRKGDLGAGAAFMEMPNVNRMRSKFLNDILGNVDLPPGVLPTSAEGRAAIKLAREEAMGRLTVGLGGFSTLLAAAALVNDNQDTVHLTGRGPTDREQRALLQATGWQPYSIFIPEVGSSKGKYVEYRRLDPFATLLGTIADMVTIGQYLHNDDAGVAEDLSLAVVGSIMNNATNKSYMTGFKSVLEILLDGGGNKFARWWPKLAASFIPVGISEAAHALAGDDDPYMREVRGFTDAVMDKLIPYHGSVDPQRNFLGDEVRRIKSMGYSTFGSIANMTVPMAFSEVSDDLIMTEIAKLQHSFTPPKPNRGGVDLRSFRNEKGQSAYDRMLELRKDTKIGGKTIRRALRDLMRSRRYQAMDPTSSMEVGSPRILEIRRIVGRFDTAASRLMMREFPEVSKKSIEVRQEVIRAKFSELQKVR
jgi:hypothetical protein